MVKLLQKLNVIPSRSEGEVMPYEPKPEQHPQSVAVAKTVTPDGQSMDEWMNGGWHKFHWN